MKPLLTLILTATLLSTIVIAADDHKHSHKIIPGPKGGKVLESAPLHSEFFVQTDRKVSITFYNDAMKAVAPTSQEIKIIAEAKTGKATLELSKTADGFLSKTALPQGNGYRIVVQIKNDAASKPQNFRVDYDPAICGGCKLAEYACTCDHAKEGHSGHKH